MSALTAIEAEVTAGTDAGEAGDAAFGRRSSGLQVVLNGAAPGPAGRPVRTAVAAQPCSSSSADVSAGRAAPVLLPGRVLASEPAATVLRIQQPGFQAPAVRAPAVRAPGVPTPRVRAPRLAAQTAHASRPAVPRARVAAPPVRLTRRGRIVVSVLVLAVLIVAALLISLLASGGAQATNHGQARAGYQGMREVVVRPGQTLWSIAAAAEPTADTRIVVQEIMTANALTSTNISAGQLIWVPR
jgi:hypothetical protein